MWTVLFILALIQFSGKLQWKDRPANPRDDSREGRKRRAAEGELVDTTDW